MKAASGLAAAIWSGVSGQTESRSDTTTQFLVLAVAASACLVAYQFLPLPLAIAALACLLMLSVRSPIAAVAAVVVALPYYEQLRPLVGDRGFSAAEAGMVITAVGSAARYAIRRLPGSVPHRREGDGAVGRWSYVEVSAAAILVLAIASLAVSIQPWESLRSFRQTILEPLMMLTVVIVHGGGKATARRLVWSIIVSAVLVSTIGLYQYVTNQNIITAEESLRRIRGLYGSPNHLGMYLGRALPAAFALLVIGRERRVVVAFAAAIIATATLLTFSVGAWIGVAAGILVVLAFKGRRAVVATLAIAVVVAAPIVPYLLGIERIASHFNLSEGTSFLRLQVWGAALDMVWDHPLLGIGLDNFLYYYRDFGYMLPGGWREPNLSHPHNLALDFWLSLGLIGLVTIGSLLYRFFRKGWRLARTMGSTNDRALAVAATASMADFVGHGLIDAAYFLPDLAVVFWLTVAILRLLHIDAADPTDRAYRQVIANGSAPRRLAAATEGTD